MSNKQTKAYGIYYWNTLDNETLFLKEFHDMIVAMKYIEERYQGQLRDNGADKIDIVTKAGNVVKQYRVG